MSAATQIESGSPLAGRRFVRQRALGTEAVYELLGESGEVVTARVVSAPGLPPGMQLRLMAAAVRAMERVDAVAHPAARARRRPPAPAPRPSRGLAA